MRLLFILIAIPTALFGQEKMFFTKHFQSMIYEKTDNVRSYSFENGACVINDVSKDTLVHKLTVYGTRDIDKLNAYAWYCIQGGNELNSKEYFKNLKAIFESYVKGEIRAKISISGTEYKYGQVWNLDGNEILVNGKGNNSYVSDDKSETFFESYEDSVLVLNYSIRTVENDTIHCLVDKMATPKEGFQEFFLKLVTVLKYPGIARLVGKEGRIYIQFIVDKNGKLTDFKPLTKEGYNFEAKVIKKLEKLPSWTPAMFKNGAVKQKFILPVTFKLT